LSKLFTDLTAEAENIRVIVSKDTNSAGPYFFLKKIFLEA
jgi:hypothetical protein